MIKVTPTLINLCASNLMFELTKVECETIVSEFDSIMAQINYLSQIENVDQIDEMTFPYKQHQKFLREDKPTKCLSIDDALKNCNSRVANQISLPKVVGNEND